MSTTIFDSEGNEVEIFARVGGAGLDAIVRAETEADWIEGAVYYGLLIAADEELIPAPGVEIDVLGPVMTDPGVRDDEGVYTTEPTYDTRYHLNLRIHGPALETVVEGTDFPKWKAMAINWTTLGEEDEAINASESARVLHAVGLIDPDTINSPSRIWL